jgi:hypothetical protein
MQHPTQDTAAPEPDAATTAGAATEAGRRAERHRAIGIAAVAAAVLYQGAGDPLRAPAKPR